MLTEHPPFDETRRRDPAAVRAYRASLAAPARPGFGMRLALDGAWRVALGAGVVSTLEAPDVRVDVHTYAPAGRRAIAQEWRFENRSSGEMALRWRWDGATLRRADYTELAEGGALPAPVPIARRWSGPDPAGGSLRLPPGGAGSVRIAVALGEDAERERDLARDAAEPSGAPERALAYARLCALRVAPDAVCILADHQILPLSWNRDAYWVAALLRARGEAALVRDHLRWLFRVAERRGVFWGRAHLANGRVKDAAFQLDQQLYPLLEAVEAGALDEYRDDVARVLRALDARRAGELYATEETPADDPLGLPFHFSSHVLLWRTLDALRGAGVPVDAERVRAAARRAFADAGRFAYATDARGAFRHYHDANDLPTAFAPTWGFCAADDPRWRATIAFAWSPANAGGFYPGPLAGLGSVHTPHPWPLGDLQEIVVARATGDAARERRAREKLARVETWDGMLPESYDERTGSVVSRHWFAWPVALRALLGA